MTESRHSAPRQRGALKIFFGAASGVGKTYAMLESAHARKRAGARVLVGAVNTHGRRDTARLLVGLEILPPRRMSVAGQATAEFDLDAALARRPDLLVIDQIAHANVPGSRYAKRWQDVIELVEAGIDVYATLNVQDLESMEDAVTQITGTSVAETVPDAVLENADEVELIDLPPRELLQRARDGKVDLPGAPPDAQPRRYTDGMLIALRELALRRLAERVSAQVQGYRQQQGVATVWPTGERLMVCVGPSPLSARLVRTAMRLAQRLQSVWFAVHVETPGLSAAARAHVTDHLLTAQRHGARAVTLAGTEVGETLLNFARVNNISRIIVGKPYRPWWRSLRGSLVDELIRGSEDMDVHVVNSGAPPARRTELKTELRIAWRRYVFAAGVVAACALLAALLRLDPVHLDAVFLLGVVAVAVKAGARAAVFAAVLAVCAFAGFALLPSGAGIVPADAKYLVNFAVMLVVAATVGALSSSLREQVETARERESRTSTLHDLVAELARVGDVGGVASVVGRHVYDVFGCRTAILVDDGAGGLRNVPQDGSVSFDPADLTVPLWVLRRGRAAGRGTESHASDPARYLPLQAVKRIVGVLGILPERGGQLATHTHHHHLQAFANQTALALERALLAETATAARLEVEHERLRNTLLSSVSHDLRTPIAAILSAASPLLNQENLDEAARRELLHNIHAAAVRLNRHVRNLLDITKLESGSVHLDLDWVPVEEVIGSALHRLDDFLRGRRVQVDLPDDLPPVPMDGLLVEQVLVNLLENAVRHTPADSPIDLWVTATPQAVLLHVADRGPGIPASDADRVFEKFYRGSRVSGTGTGLGLTICRAIVDLHQGRIWVEPRREGGAVFHVALPRSAPPHLPPLPHPGHGEVA